VRGVAGVGAKTAGARQNLKRPRESPPRAVSILVEGGAPTQYAAPDPTALAKEALAVSALHSAHVLIRATAAARQMEYPLLQ